MGLLEPCSHVHSLAAREAEKSHFLASLLGDGEKTEFIKQRCSKEAAPKHGKCPTHCYLKESTSLSAEKSTKNKSNTRDILSDVENTSSNCDNV